VRARYHRAVTLVVVVTMAVGTAACSAVGASEITVTARNDAAGPMVVGVVEGAGGDGPAFGSSHTLAPGEERELTLTVPGGGWTVTVNDGRMLGSSDVGQRRGVLPVTLVLPDADHFAGGPYWEAPAGWADTGP